MSKNDGGPAFPVVAEGGVNSGLNPEFYYGMSMRDYFAAAALQGMLCNGFRPDETFTGNRMTYARAAFIIADNMLAERAK